MTKTATAKKNTGKKARKAASRYQTVRVLRETGATLADRVRGYKADYIQRPVKRGKKFMEEFTGDPRQVIDNLADESRDFFENLRKNTRKKVDGCLKDSRKFYRQARKNPRGTFGSLAKDGKLFVEDLGSDAKQRVDGVIRSGREILEGVEKDTRLAAGELLASGKKAFEKLPGQAADEKHDTLLIKKYVNGRFYDTVNKKYLKKAELTRLVKRQKKIKIVSTKTGRDITRSVLSGLSVNVEGGGKIIPSADDLISWAKKNQKQVRESVDRQLGNIRRMINLPV